MTLRVAASVRGCASLEWRRLRCRVASFVGFSVTERRTKPQDCWLNELREREFEKVRSNVTHRQVFTMIRPRHIACGIATLLLHAMFFSSLTLGSSAAKRSPEELGPGSTELLASDGTWMTLVVVHLTQPNATAMAERVASRGEVARNPVIQVVSPDPTPLASLDPPSLEDASDAVFSAGDPAMQSLLFGRYTKQIDARIQRASPLPAPPNPSVFTNALTLTFESRAYVTAH